MNKSEIGVELIRSKWPQADDAEREHILLDLKQRGLSISDVILALRNSGFYSLDEAKEYISTSPAWHVEVENGKVLHEIAWQVLDDFVASQPHKSQQP
ncbi:hypothetical protein [Rugamonas aquatica]|uniref:Uncharacterized protein n=1 Tax=Rugamonas aquatica TaxID=2743357 RepID=A0A6A7N930_9BURK|nr:hypothetical protein [Rugamonas aquatica]MQA41590.1 hypothetical protein [Rugamonas aquatica]